MAWLFLGFMCLYVVDEQDNTAHLKAVSPTEQYEMSIAHYKFTPHKYHVGLKEDTSNIIVKAILSGEPQTTTDWVDVSRQGSDPEAVHLNQANSGIAYTVLCPLGGKVRGAIMYNYYQYPMSVGRDQWSFMQQYTQLVSECLG